MFEVINILMVILSVLISIYLLVKEKELHKDKIPFSKCIK